MFVKKFAVSILIFFTGTVQAETTVYKFGVALDPHNMLMFKVNHQGFSNTLGFFTDFHGTLLLDRDDLPNSSVNVIINTDSVDIAHHKVWNTNTKKFFFDVENHRDMTYTSREVVDLGGGQLRITGDLSLMGVTREVVLNASLNKLGDYMGMAEKAGFSANGRLKRSEFGIMTNLPAVGDDIEIWIEIEALKEAITPVGKSPN